MKNGLTERGARIAPGEWFDCPESCNSKTVNWIKGDAYCPECGEMGTVYPASVMKRDRERNAQTVSRVSSRGLTLKIGGS